MKSATVTTKTKGARSWQESMQKHSCGSDRSHFFDSSCTCFKKSNSSSCFGNFW